MITIDKYIKYLSFLDLNMKYEKNSSHFSAFNSKCNLQFCNRVIIDENITAQDLIEIKNYFATTPFSIWINEKNKTGIQLVELMDFAFHKVYPLMTINLKNISPYPQNKSITIKKISTEFDVLNLWVPLVLKAYNISAITEFQKFAGCLINKASFYIGYYENEPVATSMAIYRNDSIDIHWVGTLPEYRGKGVGFAVSIFPLFEGKQQVNEAILYASEIGKPLYEKIGFTEKGQCHVYTAKALASIG